MPLYEHVFLVRQDVSVQHAEQSIKDWKEVVEKDGGKVAKTEYWGLRPLAYKIKKNRKAHFALMQIDAPHEIVAEMERQMRLSVDVLRFLTVKVDKHDTEPSPIMRRGDRDDRRGGRFRGDGPRGGRRRDGDGRGRDRR